MKLSFFPSADFIVWVFAIAAATIVTACHYCQKKNDIEYTQIYGISHLVQCSINFILVEVNFNFEIHNFRFRLIKYLVFCVLFFLSLSLNVVSENDRNRK